MPRWDVLGKKLELIHPYDLDLNDKEIFNEFSTINPNLNEAVRLDIANHGSSHAEVLDASLGGNQARWSVPMRLVKV
jgi:hypothetical protein